MEIAIKTHKAIETLKATIEARNEELRRTNANLSQLWVTVKEALTKANINEENIKEIKNSNRKLREELKRQLKKDIIEEITELEQRLAQTTNKGASAKNFCHAWRILAVQGGGEFE